MAQLSRNVCLGVGCNDACVTPQLWESNRHGSGHQLVASEPPVILQAFIGLSPVSFCSVGVFIYRRCSRPRAFQPISKGMPRLFCGWLVFQTMAPSLALCAMRCQWLCVGAQIRSWTRKRFQWRVSRVFSCSRPG